MMNSFKYFSVLLIVVFSLNNLCAQFMADTITLESSFKGYKFYYLGEQVKAKEVMKIMEINDLALDEFSASREAYFFGSIFAIIGGALIVYPFVNSAFGYEINYGPAFAGVCFIGISIPIFRSYNKKTTLSVIKYNSDLNQSINSNSKPKLFFGSTSSGIGFRYLF